MEGNRRPADRGTAGARHGEIDDSHRGLRRGLHLAERPPDGGCWPGPEDPAGAPSGAGLGPRPAGPDHQPVRADRDQPLAGARRDADRGAGARAGPEAGRLAGGGGPHRARAVWLLAGQGVRARPGVPGALRHRAGRRRIATGPSSCCRRLTCSWPWAMAALADGRPGNPAWSRRCSGRAPRWRLLLLPVAALAVELLGPNLRVQPELVEPLLERGGSGDRAGPGNPRPGGCSGPGRGRADGPWDVRDRARPVLAPLRSGCLVLRRAEIRRRAGRQRELGRGGRRRGSAAAGLRAVAGAPHDHRALTGTAAAGTRRGAGRPGGAADPDPGRRGGQRRRRAAAGWSGTCTTGRRPGWSPSA